MGSIPGGIVPPGSPLERHSGPCGRRASNRDDISEVPSRVPSIYKQLPTKEGHIPVGN